MNSAMTSDMNSAQLFNFGTEFGWNEIEANLLGASGIISGDTPVSFIRHSVDQYLKAFGFQDTTQDNSQIGKTPTPRTKICADKDGKVVPCDSPERVEGGKSGISLRGIFGLPDVPGDASVLCSDCTAEQLEELRRTGTVSGSGGSQLFSVPFFGKVDTKALAFLVIGIALIIVAVAKL